MKEWNGNSNSARAAIAAKKPGSKTVREQDDFYATDPAALEMLLDNYSNWLNHCFNGIFCRCTTSIYHIWECACGNGNLADVLFRRRYHHYASDIKDRGYGCAGVDFLKHDGRFSDTQLPMADIILTNPPYSLATEFITHALDILPNGGLYICLMNITYLAGQKRYKEVYSKGCLREVYVFSKRIECWKNNIPSGHSSISNYAWYVFQKGYNGSATIYWL